ncbi:hypothetical protein SKAU_G00376630 [Synaphobranchus kaupii]|uniref:C2H2-type domain-containing protein n=1 Tax=Synaphobranchus kaupii TaxID=118154 RepID=A0A9Q1ECV6_SYNKA|nr:hypothetical protein SKAU_G00376630 [Synaphobranchus kaupii]
MTNFLDIHAELASIMDILAKSAVAEIGRLVDDGAALLRLEISRSHREISVLRRNLQLRERELQAARKTGRLQERFSQGRSVTVPVCSVVLGAEREKGPSPLAARVFGQEWSFHLRRDGEPTGVQEVDTPLQSGITQNQSANMEQIRPEPFFVKKERLEEDPQPTPVEEEQETEPTPAGDPEELSEQHRCGHGDEELSEVEFVVKAEQEEEHVALRLNQTGCENSAGLNNLGSEYVMYEGDSQLWTSFTQGDSDIETDEPVCSKPIEHSSQSLSVHSPLQHDPATMEVSGNTLSSFAASYVEGFDKMSEKSSVCSEELRSEAINTQQGQYRERLGSMTKEDVMSHQQQPQFTESTLDTLDGDRCALRTRAETRAKARRRARTGEKRFSCAQCGKSFTTRFYLKIHRRIHTGERPFTCTQCGKSFYCTSHLTSHQRSHTGEKPYSCDECGNSYSHLNSLKLHYRVHKEEREPSCT